MTLRIALLAVCLASPAFGQVADIAFGGMRQDTGQPVEVTSERLEVDQEAGVATFTGDVVVVQGQMRMTAPQVRVEYQAGEGGSGDIDTMHATEGVTLVNGDDAAEGEEALYSVAEGTVVMTGDVIVTQESSILSGQRLFVDLETGSGTMEGRVRTIFQSADQ